MEKQLNFVNNLNNRVRKRYYIDNNSEFDLIPHEENNQVYSINDNQLFQMEVANEEEEISDNIVSFIGRQKTKIEKLQTNIEPVQNLNGYDNPWPAGGGKNIINPENYQGASVTSNGVTFTRNSDGSVSANGTASGTTASYTLALANAFHVDAETYTLSAKLTGTISGANAYVVTSGGSGGTGIPYTALTFNEASTKSASFTASASGNLAYIMVQVAVGATINATFYPQLELGSTTTAYSPYSNICPITGWDSVTVNRTGKNLFNPDSTNTDWVGANGSIYQVQSAKTNYIPVAAGQTLTISNANSSSGTSILLIAFFDLSDAMLSRNVAYSGEKFKTATAPQNTAYAIVSFYDWEQTAEQQCELGSTATAYEPYNGNEYTITLGETVYGGTLDVVNGKMTVTHKGVDMGSLTYGKNTTLSGVDRFIYAATDATSISQYAKTAAITSVFGAATISTLNNNLATDKFGQFTNQFYFYIAPNVYADGTAFATAMTGQTLVYPLATPFELTLTPEQIATLQGTNNVWSDVGPITLKYSTKGLTTYLLKP